MQGNSGNMSKISRLQEKAEFVLQKKNIINVKCKITFCLDISASMERFYKSGKVQEILNRLFGLVLAFSPLQNFNVYIFGENCKFVNLCTGNNVHNFVEKQILDNHKYQYDTLYYPAISMILDDIFENKISNRNNLNWFQKNILRKKPDFMSLYYKPEYPELCVFMTDGDNWDKEKTEELIRRCSSLPLFWQFVGVKSGSYDFLEKLDNLKDTYIDNCNFFKCDDISTIDDHDLYERLVNEFPQWYKKIKKENLISN